LGDAHPQISDDPSVDEWLTELTATWRAAGIDRLRLSADAGGTVAPEGWDQTVQDTLVDDEVAALGFDLDREASKLELGEVLGEGGAGVVRLARQRSLARDVAVKVLYDKDEEEEQQRSRARLLREARVTGALEHPNIVPVHDLGHDERGVPMIVMKRIEGTGWNEALRKDRLGDDGRLSPDRLEAHLQILIQVARATHFAHARGVLHRDLKPENVMIGAFGEVYLVDWGIAAALNGCEVPGLPRADAVDDIFGTPAYMAPEMAAGEGAALSPRTDVYLLGSVLCELLTGRPPHKMPEMVQMLVRAYRSEKPELPRHVPRGLEAICTRAMSRDSGRRFASAAAFAEALEDFLRHRHALSLVDEGVERFARLEELIAQAHRKTVDAGRAAALYRECRFAFTQALRIWENAREAKKGAQRAAETMIAFELDQGRAESARALLEDLAEPRPELTTRVHSALHEREESSLRLQAIAHDHDVTLGDRHRSLATALLSIGSITLNLVCGILDRQPDIVIEHKGYAIAHGVNLLWGATIVVLLRRAVMANQANRNMSFGAILNIFSYVVLLGLSAALELPFAPTLVFLSFTRGIMWLFATVAVDRLVFTLPIMAFVEIPLLILFPQHAFFILATSIGVALLGSALLWSRRARKQMAS
jgi:serine/threonine-protein kinase